MPHRWRGWSCRRRAAARCCSAVPGDALRGRRTRVAWQRPDTDAGQSAQGVDAQPKASSASAGSPVAARAGLRQRVLDEGGAVRRPRSPRLPADQFHPRAVEHGLQFGQLDFLALFDASATHVQAPASASAARLQRHQFTNALVGQRQLSGSISARVNGAPRPCPAPRRSRRRRHHHVHVGCRRPNLDVFQVEQRRAVDDAHRHRGHEVADRAARDAGPAPAASSPRRARPRRRR